MHAVKLTEDVWWVGAIDWAIRDFHGYATHRGTTYNAYLIIAEKVALVDTVKLPFRSEMLARIATVIDPDRIDIIISNHAEMDHSGALPDVIDIVKPHKVYASEKGVETLKRHYDLNCDIVGVSDGETLSLGNKKLTFYEMRMLHWPDSMATYLHGDGILFSQDAFGMHLASSSRFDDELDASILRLEAAKYYANILTPYSNFVSKQLARFDSLDIDIRFIAPDHGPVWRSQIADVLRWYAKWSRQAHVKRAVVAYATMWQSTAIMAAIIADAISEQGVEVEIFQLSSAHRSDVATALLEAGALVVGSPTINNQVFPTVADLLNYIKGLRFRNLVGSAFGSFGWSGEAVKLVAEELEDMGIELVGAPVRARYRPSISESKSCQLLGYQIAEAVIHRL